MALYAFFVAALAVALATYMVRYYRLRGEYRKLERSAATLLERGARPKNPFQKE